MHFSILCLILRMNLCIFQRFRQNPLLSFENQSIYNVCKDIIVIFQYFFSNIFLSHRLLIFFLCYMNLPDSKQPEIFTNIVFSKLHLAFPPS